MPGEVGIVVHADLTRRELDVVELVASVEADLLVTGDPTVDAKLYVAPRWSRAGERLDLRQL